MIVIAALVGVLVGVAGFAAFDAWVVRWMGRGRDYSND